MGLSDQKKILIIEDDPRTANLIAIYLEREGFRPLTAQDGEKGLSMAKRHVPDMVILDLMIPKIDGWEVCRRLRQQSDMPIIMLTARSDEIDRVSGLTMGADDYVVKPFSPRELVARVRAVLRRVTNKTPDKTGIFSHEGLMVDTKNRRVSVSSKPVHLTHHEYALLTTFITSPGRTFNRDELLDKLYPKGEAAVIDRVVDVHIGKLRAKIEPDPSSPRYILTERGIGYRFADHPPDEAGTLR
jgi:DNA-binding response OmpR family regulator